MKKYCLKSPAKINLTLEVIKKLPNGYHELRSVMLKLEKIYDEIELVINEKGKGIKIFCLDKRVPRDSRNTCWKIVQSFFKEYGGKIGISIKIKKRIPVLAGMGGGSSNAASVLLALNDYFGKPLGVKRLLEVGAEVGKDIPFFLEKEKMAYIQGTGEITHPISRPFPYPILIISPNVDISTADAFAELDRNLWYMNVKERKNISSQMVAAIRKGKDIFPYLYNDFKALAVKACPEIETVVNFLIAFGALGTGVSGKGPTVFGIFKEKKAAVKIYKILKGRYPDYFISIS